MAANSLLNRSWSALGGILSAVGGSWRLPGAIWAILEADIAKTMMEKRRPGGMRRPALDGLPSFLEVTDDCNRKL